MWKSLALCVPLLTLSAATALAEVPKVVTSIQPLHSLAAMVMDGIGQPTLLVSGNASEHGYAMKPSDIRVLQQAQIALIVDTGYETFLAKPLKAQGKKIQVLAMADLPGMTVFEPRAGGLWDGHHAKHDHDSHGPDHHDQLDGHLWLNTSNAQILVAALTEALAEKDPDNAIRYRRNADSAKTRLAALDAQLRDTLAPIKDRPYVVFHDAYQYFEARYGLSPAGSITVDPDRPPPPKRLAALKDKLVQAKAACVFREPQFPAPIVETLAKAANAKTGLLDPQGAALPPGPDLYPTLMTNLADSLTKCLSAP